MQAVQHCHEYQAYDEFLVAFGISPTVVQQQGKMYSMNNRRTYCWRKHVQKVMFDSSDSFSVLTGSNNGRRRFIEKVIRVQEMDSMGTASKDFIKRSLAYTQNFVRKHNQRDRAVELWHGGRFN